MSDTTTKPTNPKDAIGTRKAKFTTLPMGALFGAGNAMLEGACKYGRHNYRAIGVRAGVYVDAAMGHVADWWEGEDIDPDSGLNHIDKAIASLLILRDAMMQGKLTDDRPPRSKVHKRDFNADAARLIDMHAFKSPKHWTIDDGAAGERSAKPTPVPLPKQTENTNIRRVCETCKSGRSITPFAGAHVACRVHVAMFTYDNVCPQWTPMDSLKERCRHALHGERCSLSDGHNGPHLHNRDNGSFEQWPADESTEMLERIEKGMNT